MATEEIISNRDIIIDCLQAVVQHHGPVYLSPFEDAESGVFESRIQSVQSDPDHLILHQVLPAHWRDVIAPQTKLEIRSCMNLGNIRFAGYLQPLDDSDNNPYCRLSLPSKIYRKQLRDYFRVSLLKIDTTASLRLTDGSELVGKCKDFSMAGAQFVLPTTASSLAPGQTIAHCTLVIDDMLDIGFSGKICSLQYTDKEILAGIQFLDLSPSQAKPISVALNKIERQNINT